MQLARAIRVLCDAEVDFVVIGGVSATLHGSTRTNYDLDICYSRDARNLQRLRTALAPFHPRPRDLPTDPPFIWGDVMLGNATLLTLLTDIGEIDLLAEVAGLCDFSEATKRSIMIDAFDRKFATLDLPALIQSKRAAGREKDLSALPELESIFEASR